MAYEVVTNPHNLAYGSTTATGVVSVAYTPVSIAPQAALADDASVAILRRSSHIAFNGVVTMNDMASARALAAQTGPDTLSFDAEESDSNADSSYSFASAEFGVPQESVSLGGVSQATIPFSALAMTPT